MLIISEIFALMFVALCLPHPLAPTPLDARNEKERGTSF